VADKVLVIGGSGLLGAPVVRALLARGREVRLLSRRPASLRGPFAQAELVEGDVRSPDTVARALEGCSGVHVSLRGATHAEAEATEGEGVGAVGRAAAAAGAKVTYLSNAGISDCFADIPFVRIKLRAEEGLKASGARHAIFRCTHFMDSLPQFVRGKSATIIGRQTHHYHYLAADDYAEMVVRAHEMPETDGQTYDVLGPEPFTMREALTIYLRHAHPGMKIGQIPLPMVWLLGRLTRNPELSRVAELFAAFEKMPEGADPSLANQTFGAPTTRLEQWARARAA
jgi:uncharacterized protein YbjT (DUF2867 family)